MNVIYQTQGQEFEWDDQKAEGNIEKHGISFEQAAEVFFDPFYQMGDASIPNNSELRQFVIG